MQERLKVSSNINKSDWLDIVETLSVLGAIGGSIASVVSQQIVFASIPLSLSVALNLVNRRRLLDSINHSDQTAIAQIVQENVETQAKLGTLTQQLAEVQQLSTSKVQGISNLEDYTQLLQSNQTAIAQLIQENVETQAKIGLLTQQLAEVQQLSTGFGQGTSNLQDYTQIESLLKEQTKIAKTVDYLREISTCTQAIRVNPNDAKAYYNRGSTYQSLEDKEAAIADYTEAIRINPSYAQAYYNRGLVCGELGDKKGAVEDLREAAKLFFEEGDIASYQTARDFSKKFHDLDSQPKTDTLEEVAVKSLFA